MKEYNIRKHFCSRWGEEGILAEFDFSQLEVAALAEISRDEVLLYEVNNGVDIHTENAALWLKCSPMDVSKEQRKKAKIMTFQLQYGAGAKKMAESLGISASEAATFINTFYDKYRRVGLFHTRLKEIRDTHQHILDKQELKKDTFFILNDFSPTGRKYSILSREDKKNPGRWFFSLTEMKNYPVQGFATADVVPIVINMVYEKLTQSYTGRLINTIHDSFVIDCEGSEFGDILRRVEEVFTEFPTRFKELFDYELLAEYNYDVKFGWNLSDPDMKKLTREEVKLFIS